MPVSFLIKLQAYFWITGSAATKMNSDLSEINVWSNQWKMTFNPDPNKQPQEVIFSRKMKKTLHTPLNFNDNSVKQVQF